MTRTKLQKSRESKILPVNLATSVWGDKFTKCWRKSFFAQISQDFGVLFFKQSVDASVLCDIFFTMVSQTENIKVSASFSHIQEVFSGPRYENISVLELLEGQQQTKCETRWKRKFELKTLIAQQELKVCEDSSHYCAM